MSVRIASVSPRKAVVATPTEAAEVVMAVRIVPKLAAVVTSDVRRVANWPTSAITSGPSLIPAKADAAITSRSKFLTASPSTSISRPKPCDSRAANDWNSADFNICVRSRSRSVKDSMKPA